MTSRVLLTSSLIVASAISLASFWSHDSSYNSILSSAMAYLPAVFPSYRAALDAARAHNAPTNFTGRRAVVVGGTSGIGHGIALRLAKANFGVTIVGRNEQRGREIVRQMAALGGSGHEFVACDAMLLANLRAFAADYAKRHETLDVLVETQGMGSIQGRTETKEGLDEKLALHFYGRMAAIDALLPLLRRATSARVLSVLAAGVHGAYKGYATDPELRSSYSLKNAADAGCFYNDVVLDAYAQDEPNRGITFVHAAPGFVNTNWGTEMPFYIRGLVRLIQPLGTSIEDCAEFMSIPLLASDAEAKALREQTGGVYLMGAHGQRVGKTDLHEEAKAFLWRHVKEVLARASK